MLVAALFCLMTVCFFLWGVPFPLFHIEKMSRPLPVHSTSGNVIQFSSGTVVCLDKLSYIPTNALIQDVLKRGLSYEDGKTLGLVTLHHWCGNDPVRYDVRRVDFELLCAYVDVRCLKGSEITNDGFSPSCKTSMHYTKHGWRYEEYLKFLSGCRHGDQGTK